MLWKRDCSMIHQWFINSKSLNHEMWFFFKERHLYKFGWILQKVSAYLTSFAFSLQLLWKWTKLLNFKFWFNFLSKAHVPSRLWVNAYIREVCGWKFDQMDDPSIQISTSLICIYSQATRNVKFRQEIKSKLSFPFNSSCI